MLPAVTQDDVALAVVHIAPDRVEKAALERAVLEGVTLEGTTLEEAALIATSS